MEGEYLPRLPPMRLKPITTSQVQIQRIIEQIAGGPVLWGFEGNLEDFRNTIDKKRWEDTVKQYCVSLCDMLVRDCSYRDLKEEFVYQFYARKIVFKYDHTRTTIAPQTEMANGCLKIIFGPQCFNLGPFYILSEENALPRILFK